MFLPKRAPFRHFLAQLAMMAIGFSFRRGSSRMTTAFSFATMGVTSPMVTRTTSVAASHPGWNLPNMARSTSRWTVTPTGMARRMSSTALSQAATADVATTRTLDLAKCLEVTHPAYDVIKKDVVNEYGAYCVLYRHKKSGAELLSVAMDDDNKVFGITFRTPPQDSTGVPHILEHSVLCGSRKYTTKDPFVHLLKGSLQTFLNAFTYPDRTCYVVASQNLKDFYNLINVYTDAVFHPRAIKDPLVLAQEGWHLELETEDEPLTYKGVVYNEMKGVYSSPDSLLNRASQQSIFPDNAYSVDSGGDPQKIPDLTFEQFSDFHRKFYHPSNSRIYFSGDDDVYQRLALMDEYLSEFDQLGEARQLSRIEWQPKRYTEPVKEVLTYPVGESQPETHMVMVNWLLNDRRLSEVEELTLTVLDHLLMGTTSSILKKTLMESGLGEAITGGGLTDELLQSTYSVGLKGVLPENVTQVEQLVIATLEKVAKEGFEADDIASSLNTIEFQLREFNTGSFPKGLSLMLGCMSKWVYDEDPTGSLKFEAALTELKKKINESGSKVFQDMLNEFLVRNSHRTTVELLPSKTMEEEVLKDEAERLSAIRNGLDSNDVQKIIEDTKTLKELQAAEDSMEARSTIPQLEISDLKRETTEYPISISNDENGSGITVVRHELGSTSGIAYVNFAVDLSVLPLEDVPLLPLLTKVMMETGAGEFDSVALSRELGTHTGGVDVSLLTTAVHRNGVDESAASNGELMQSKLMIRGKATVEKVEKLLSLMQLILTNARFDAQSKVIELLKESKSRLRSRVQGAGHAICSTRMKARYRPAGYIDEISSGLSYLEAIDKLVEQAEKDWPSLLSRLEDMRAKILNADSFRRGFILDITGDKSVLDAIKPNIDQLLEHLPGQGDQGSLPNFYEDVHPWVVEAQNQMANELPLIDEGFVVPTQVSYVGKAGLVYDEGEAIPGSAAVVARFLRTGYLWDHVRVIGGAYGGFCNFSPFSGLITFLSYRDPNLHKTIDVYDASADALMAAADAMEVDPDILTTAIIGTIGDLDGALSPDQKGYTSFQRWLINESPEYRQRYRDEILRTTPDDFRDFARRLQNLKSPSVAVVSSRGAFEAAAKAGKSMVLKEIA